MFTFQIGLSDLIGWTLPILCSAALAYIFSTIYVVYGEAHSNRESFAKNFVLLAMITTAIIMIIKQSIALSLGLVGALSIVRFRAAIKEPEELSYLFMMIAIGIGVGAGEYGLIVVFSVIAAIILVGRHYLRRKETGYSTYNVNIISKRAKEEGPESVLNIQKKWCNRVALKRFDETRDELDMLVFAEFKDEESFNNWRTELIGFDNGVRVSFLDQQGVF